jgi:hypothetical protein
VATAPVASRPAASIRWTRYAGIALVVLAPPLVVFAALQSHPRLNPLLVLPVQHFFVVTNVALLAAGVALLVARAALQTEQRRVLLIALGFMSMAGLFAVHGIATPGVMGTGAGAPGDAYYGPIAPSAPGRYDYDRTVIGLSAYLSLFVPSLFFAAA